MSTDINMLATGLRTSTDSAMTGNKVVQLRPAARQETAAVAEGVASSTATVIVDAQQTSTAKPEQDDVETLRAKVAELNQGVQRRLHFAIDDAAGLTVITVRDRDTDEVIRQIPSEELVALARYFSQVTGEEGVSKGLLLRAEV